ncbi:hypothetical protein M0R04_04775 [Candidatus Dojkabacteria bacterium]|jgi:hypothetical protein|nr:hypothetical protein [Candidatus Dojkabacteria bacterium]
MRNRDKKGYPQFVGRIIAWKSSHYKKSKIFYVRVAGFDYHIGFTFVDVDNDNDNFSCYNGPLSPNGMFEVGDYDKAFEYALKVLRSNGVYVVDEINKVSRVDPNIFSNSLGMTECAFSV